MNIRDIARLSGVGVSTVSRVLNNHQDVKESTREKVMQVIKDSNYVPNNSARILKQNSTNNIGVLVKGVFNPLFSEMTNIIGSIVNESGYTMILEQNDFTFKDDLDTLQAFIKEKRLQGAICLGGNFERVDRKKFETLEVPVVLTSVNTIYKDSISYSSVGIDNIKAAYDATNYLINLGHRNIAIMIGEENDIGISRSRLNGYRHALEESNINFYDKNVLIGKYKYDKAYLSMQEFLKKNNDITAIFSISDVMAVGIAKAIVDAGLQIGEDISIIGFDGMDISDYYNPGITTVKQPKEEMAEKSARLLLKLISKEVENTHLILDTELILRNSCKRVK